jgi:NADPH-dependent 2,4-dienoyl-CoA reductase/sulfur reductase-like enzyme
MGSQEAKYERLHRQFEAARSTIDYRELTSVWAIEGHTLFTERNGHADVLAFDALIVASGATDRIVPLPGWTVPGVFSLGGAQIALKDQGAFIGRRVAFVGSSPLLALAAKQYQAMGATIAGVFDTTPFFAKIRAVPYLLHAPDTALRGLSYLAQLLTTGVPLHFGVDPVRIEGCDHVETLVLRDGKGREMHIDCDAVALGYGLKPETQLAELAGASFAFDELFRMWLPIIDADGRAAPDLYLAGDGAAIGGADAAEASGTLASLALLADKGHTVTQSEVDRLRATIKQLRRFQRGLAIAFAWPHRDAGALPGETIVCRCENVIAGDIRAALGAGLIPPELNRVKAITRCGMGRCQGRMCGPALQEIVAAQSGAPVATVGRLRTQAPIKPIALSAAETQR